ncbi:hypothetical protein AA313_de0207574 [Arthrobotrys entomopaga]|nr:hypothetical protein AA313_de0207574 [Arthrobotrys entomopaga]
MLDRKAQFRIRRYEHQAVRKPDTQEAQPKQYLAFDRRIICESAQEDANTHRNATGNDTGRSSNPITQTASICRKEVTKDYKSEGKSC